MLERSSVLDEFKEHNGIMGNSPNKIQLNISSDADLLFLEDESGNSITYSLTCSLTYSLTH